MFAALLRRVSTAETPGVKRRTLARHRTVASQFLFVLVAVAFAFPAAAQSVSAAPHSEARFGTVPPFTLTDSRGETVTLDDLAGEPWIASCFFAECRGPCPRLNADIRRFLYAPLEGSSIRLVSISVDPERDTPERLAEYADGFGADPERWLFLTGDEDAVHGLVTRGFALPVQRPPLDADPSEEDGASPEALAERMDITHSTRLVVVDDAGKIAGYYEAGGMSGLDADGLETSFAAALARARALSSEGAGGGAARTWLPRINAGLNAVAALLLVLGLRAIHAGRRETHAAFMRAAFLFSAIFLASYVYYHTVVLPLSGGPTRYHGTGWTRTAYLAMLASHVVLAAVNLPMVLWTFWLAHRGDWERHKRWAKKTFPIWLYVSVTGVLVYVVLYHGNPDPGS